MPGRRRYRLLTFCAIVIVFLLYRVVQNTLDDSTGYSVLSPVKPQPAHWPAVVKVPGNSKLPSWTNEKLGDLNTNPKEKAPGVKAPGLKHNGEFEEKKKLPQVTESELTEPYFKDVIIQVKDRVHKEIWPENNVKSKSPPNDETNEAILNQPKVHWRPFPDHFPVPEESLIPLPTGTTKKIPKIQYDFETESESQRQTRVERLSRVKTEIERAWGGYKKFAWMHDELSPVSAKHRDPFCGWAATLVDSLDTLWIAGLKKEFDEAAKAVGDIDFTWTRRNDIPVFETTIRYLGGLLAAFDVSGGPKGPYSMLIDKATELAEIIMSTFDTPNRMPVLYFEWKPDHASQPRRTGRVGLAELATLSMEFTRLAQITGKNKYYDAIDRITNGLVEMQGNGTTIPGLFPEGIDASGCNKTAATLRAALSKAARGQIDAKDLLAEPEGYVPTSGIGSHRLRPTKTAEDGDKLKRGDTSALMVNKASKQTNSEETPKVLPNEKTTEVPPFAADGRSSDWECLPQGLIPSGYGYESFHMAGGQDSAYEYFPKEYLLLGGLESKYQKLYEDAIEGINEWLMFRPMATDNWDVLFPARISTNARPDNDLMPIYEITHLTCFIGGMYGLGGKIFGREKDVEMAKQLTDGCVWAYQLFPSGIMPEAAHVVPCPTLEKCDFNETLWWDHLDTSKEWRAKEIAKIEREEKEKKENKQAKGAADAQDLTRAAEGAIDPLKREDAQKLREVAIDHDDGAHVLSSSHNKRGVILSGSKGASTDDGESQLPKSLKDKLRLNEDGSSNLKDDEQDSLSSETEKEKPKQKFETVTAEPDTDEPVKFDGWPSVPRLSVPSRMAVKVGQKPLSHEDYVQQKIEDKGLPPGFVDITSRSYYLRYV